MCGIAGIVARQGPAGGAAGVARRMAHVLFHRGPDAGAVWAEGPVALGHRRLKIIDLSERGAQPMVTADGRYRIAYNGEIYNYRELRRELEGRGVRFASESDTEVLLVLLAEHGRAALERLNGIFAFALWDRQAQVLTLARDHLGVKPVYYAFDRDRLIFASEIKALVAAGWPAEPDAGRVGEYLAYGSVAGEGTLFRGVHRLPPGGWLELRRDREPETGRYFEPGGEPHLRVSSREATARVREGLGRAVERQLVADVPVGSMCSGGIDSSVVTALFSQGHAGIDTYCIKIPVPGFDESTFGRRVAEHCGTTHHELESQPEDAAALLPTLVWLHDEPLAHPNSVPIFAVSRLARQRVTVLLSGEGSDEIFAGYSTYHRYRDVLRARTLAPGAAIRLARLVAERRGARRAVQQLLRAAAARDPVEALLVLGTKTEPEALARVAPGVAVGHDVRRAIAEGAWRRAEGDAVLAALLNDQATHLQTLLDRQDKMCMGTSVESRVPFLDVDLVRLANRLPASDKVRVFHEKAVLRRACEGLLPQAILQRRKFPFALPLSAWLARTNALTELLGELDRGELARCGIVDGREVAALARAVREGRGMYSDLLWYVLNLELWWRVFVTKTVTPDRSQLPAWREAAWAKQREEEAREAATAAS
jgi:asparagine synthase (glutamine-hydrolysing)